MQWLLALETENDPIPACRLLNIFRRKGVRIDTLTLAARPAAYSLVALVETPETEINHIFNFLRRTEGVLQVSCYRHEPAAEAKFLFIDAGTDGDHTVKLAEFFKPSKCIFASRGKYLLEVPAEGRVRQGGIEAFPEARILPFARVMTTERVPSPQFASP